MNFEQMFFVWNQHKLISLWISLWIWFTCFACQIRESQYERTNVCPNYICKSAGGKQWNRLDSNENEKVTVHSTQRYQLAAHSISFINTTGWFRYRTKWSGNMHITQIRCFWMANTIFEFVLNILVYTNNRWLCSYFDIIKVKRRTLPMGMDRMTFNELLFEHPVNCL